MKNCLYFVILAVFYLGLSASVNPPPKKNITEEIVWRTPNEGVLLARTFKKKIMFGLYTDWCGYCNMMNQKTYSDPAVIAYINQKFVAVKYNAENKETIEFLDKKFNYLPDKKVNELAYLLLEGKMRYPTTVIMTQNAEILSPVQGYMEPQVMLQVLRYYGDDIYLHTKWEDYKKQFETQK